MKNIGAMKFVMGALLFCSLSLTSQITQAQSLECGDATILVEESEYTSAGSKSSSQQKLQKLLETLSAEETLAFSTARLENAEEGREIEINGYEVDEFYYADDMHLYVQAIQEDYDASNGQVAYADFAKCKAEGSFNPLNYSHYEIYLSFTEGSQTEYIMTVNKELFKENSTMTPAAAIEEISEMFICVIPEIPLAEEEN